jgi:hypothetical protein
MPFETMVLWLTPQQSGDVNNQLQHTSNHVAERWIECVNEQSESKLRLQFIPALWCYLQSHPPRDGYEGFFEWKRLILFGTSATCPTQNTSGQRWWSSCARTLPSYRSHSAHSKRAKLPQPTLKGKRVEKLNAKSRTLTLDVRNHTRNAKR